MNIAATAIDKALFREEGDIGTITFNNLEQHNAMSRTTWAIIRLILDDFKNDQAVRVVVPTGAGGRSFVSGANISKFRQRRANEEQVPQYDEATDKAFNGLYGFPKTAIAMIGGNCIGGGLGLALCADIHVCADNSKFGGSAAKLSLGYRYVGFRRPIDLVGVAKAQGMGLVNRVVPSTNLESYVQKYAKTISCNVQLMMRALKVTGAAAFQPALADACGSIV